MALTDKYAGSTLRIASINLKDNAGDPILLSFFDNIIVEVYTSTANIVKFSLVAKDGYLTLTPVTTSSFSFAVLSEKTKLFRGECFMEIKGVKDDTEILLENNGIGRTSLGINFLDNNIKNAR